MLDAGWLLAGAGDCCQGLFGEFLGQHVLEEEGLGEKVELSLQERRRGRKTPFFNSKKTPFS